MVVLDVNTEMVPNVDEVLMMLDIEQFGYDTTIIDTSSVTTYRTHCMTTNWIHHMMYMLRCKYDNDIEACVIM